MQTPAEKLTLLREKMREHKIDFYYVPTRDVHNNEYVPAHWQRRAWLTHFTGSYGEVLVGENQAYLWTDPRYYLQASLELDEKHIQLMKQIQGVGAPVSAWLADNASHATVGVDPAVLSLSQSRQWSNILAQVSGKLVAIPENLVDHIWKPEKPQFKPVRILDVKYAGLTASEKLAHVRSEMQKVRAEALVISQMDEIAWLFNIRGNDVPYNPLVVSFALMTMHDAFLFAHEHCITDQEYFIKENITAKPYDDFAKALQALKGPVWIDPATASWWMALQLKQATLIEKASPIVMMKAIKNQTELAGMHEAHRLDAIAVVKFLVWIEKNWENGINEVSASDQLEKFRREDSRCKDLSFTTICGFADHGAIVHYHAEEKTAHNITDQNMLLVDSGAQYFEGTTDITRTIHLGNPSEAQKKHYTLVLKGHLALRHTPFPDGVFGEHIDALARAPLWHEGLDFGHGTGHGVGCYLCVHEGPQRISYGTTNIALKPGMIVSNEPGLYLAGQYGIRIENLCVIVHSTEGFYTMEDLTMVPYARKLIDVNLLSSTEIEWINEYHRDVFDLLSKTLSGDELEWLKAETKPV